MDIVPDQSVTSVSDTDAMLIRMWLHGRPHNTAAAYGDDARRFLRFAGVPLAAVTLADLQRWDASLAGFAHATRSRRVAAVKSLIAFAVAEGDLAKDVGAGLKLERPTETATTRILSPVEVTRMIAAETEPRLRAMLRLLYVCGLRASELCGLRWRDLAGGDRKGGEAKILGKGGKLRVVLVPADLWRDLSALATTVRPETPVIPGRDGGALDRGAVHRAVKRAARRAGVNPATSAHWLRHSHATHALDGGCKIHVLRESLGHASLVTTQKYLHARAGDGSASYIKG